MNPSRSGTLFCTSLALLAFAANSLLCRMALRETAIDAASFTSLRILSGALVLLLLSLRQARTPRVQGDWIGGLALFAYAAAFSFAYTRLSTGTGALLLFGAVQTSMILWGWKQGERPRKLQGLGVAIAFCGLIVLLLPGIAAPPPLAAGSMLLAGLAWGVYSLRGRGASDPLQRTAGNFLRAAPLAVVLSVVLHADAHWDARGAMLAIVSGSLTSGVGYAIWYRALAGLDATRAASVQLSVPVLAALAGVLWLDEQLSLRLVLTSVAILGGIALVIARGARRTKSTAD
jgi:drug/metabolite transporter (DMT)-like permease